MCVLLAHDKNCSIPKRKLESGFGLLLERPSEFGRHAKREVSLDYCNCVSVSLAVSRRRTSRRPLRTYTVLYCDIGRLAGVAAFNNTISSQSICVTALANRACTRCKVTTCKHVTELCRHRPKLQWDSGFTIYLLTIFQARYDFCCFSIIVFSVITWWWNKLKNSTNASAV